MSTRLAEDFYAQDTIEVARQLLGQRLVHRLPNGQRLSGRIVETEAYLGVEDEAAHSFGGRRTPRTEVMFGAPGTSYVYFIYGMYFCFNVVVMPKGNPQAVLIRALEPIEGTELMLHDRPHLPIEHLANGPGKLCSALGITKAHNQLDLTQSKILWIERDDALLHREIVDGPRVGIGDSNDAVHWPLRYGLKDHPALSRPKFMTP